MMRQPLQVVARPPVPTSIPYSTAAPYGGWNTRDPVAAMPGEDAVLLDNFVAYPGEVKMRKGANKFAQLQTGGVDVATPIETLMAFRGQSTSAKLFAATESGIYDVTVGGNIDTAAPAVSVTNGRWQHVNFANSSGSWLIAVNGTDNMRQYNGAAWSSVPDFTAGFETNKIIGVEVYTQRLFFVPKGELAFWYLDAGAVTGTALRFRVGQVCKRGGYTVALAAWTVDAGEGSGDYLAVITSEGEVSIWQGLNPAVAQDWLYKGTYYIGKPIGNRCTMKLGGDVIILTERGAVELSSFLTGATTIIRKAISDKIDPTIVEAMTTDGATFGWDMVTHMGEKLFLINHPTKSTQYCMHLQSKGWSRFLGWDANAFIYYDSALYFSSQGYIAVAYQGFDDFDTVIVADCVPAFNGLGMQQPKSLSLMRPIFSSSGRFGHVVGGCTDYVVTVPLEGVDVITVLTSLWDSGLWDTATWNQESEKYMKKDWQTVAASVFSAFAPYIRVVSASVRVSLVRVDYQIRPAASPIA